MAEQYPEARFDKIECCPLLVRRPVCDRLDLRYSLTFNQSIGDDRRRTVPVEVILHFRFERCSGPLVLGDLIYTTTLLPGERVKLFSSDRHTRWSYDSETHLGYRHETTSEESYLTWGMAQSMSDLTVAQSGFSIGSYDESWASGGGGGGINLGIIKIGGGGGGGSYDATSTYAFAQSLTRHAESSLSQVASGVRAKSTTAIGEVDSRSHAEGESETHLESSSRIYRNPNRCHAVTYLFYKINKLQKVRFSLVAIERRVSDPAAPVEADKRDIPDNTGMVAVKPQVVLATSKNRLDIERMARECSIERQRSIHGMTAAGIRTMSLSPDIVREPLKIDLRQAAIAGVDKELADAGMLDPKTGKPTDRIIAELSWEREETIPTPGIMVKGCMDECNVCEPAVRQEVELDLERKHLENEMLQRQIELLDKAQEYRCCPAGSEESEEEPCE